MIFVTLIYAIRTKIILGFFSRTWLLRWQSMRKRYFLKKVKNNFPFYQKKTDFPILNKETFNQNFSELNTAGISYSEALKLGLRDEQTRDFQSRLHDLNIGLSTGTSGRRGVFLYSDYERWKWLGLLLGRLNFSEIYGHRVAFFLRSGGALYDSVQESKLMAFCYFDLTKSEEDLKKRLISFRPTLLVAPPNVISLIQFWNTHSQKKLQLKKIISIADVLDGEERASFQNHFQCSVHEIYQATEGFLGMSCPEGHMHLNEDSIFFELREIQKGIVSPLVTDLERSHQAIVRYEINDLLALSYEPCSCSWPTLKIEKIIGRSDDLLWVRNLDGILKPVYPDYIRALILSELESQQDFQLIQNQFGDCELIFTTNVSKSAEESIIAKLIGYFAEKKLSFPKINISQGLRRDLQVKRCRVRSQIQPSLSVE